MLPPRSSHFIMAFRLFPGLPGALLPLPLLLLGCGHPATQRDCEEVLDKIIELKLREQNVQDPVILEKRKAETREARAKELMPQCLGRKITEEAMRCVRAAKTREEITSVCLR